MIRRLVEPDHVVATEHLQRLERTEERPPVGISSPVEHIGESVVREPGRTVETLLDPDRPLPLHTDEVVDGERRPQHNVGHEIQRSGQPAAEDIEADGARVVPSGRRKPRAQMLEALRDVQGRQRP